MEKPTIRILQRPCQSSTDQSSESSRPPAVIKSLEQKEADYAAARLRIMGSDSSEIEWDESEVRIGNIKNVTNGIGQNGYASARQPQPSHSNVSLATPLMFIPLTSTGSNSDFGTSNTPSLSNGSHHNRGSLNTRQGPAVVNVPYKLPQQYGMNGVRSGSQVHEPQQRNLTASASSPSLFPNSSRTAQPLFPSQPGAANAGLLPTPPGFNYLVQNANLTGTGSNGLHHSDSAAFALMHQISLLRQHTLNGFQYQLVPPAVSHTNTSFNHFNFSSVHSQPNINPKYAHPPAFN